MILTDIPFPPSDNHLFPTFKGRRIISREYNEWAKAMLDWASVQIPTLSQAREEFSRAVFIGRGSTTIAVEIYLIRPRHKIFTKTKGADPMRKWDATNYQKAVLDWISDMLGIDDRYFTVRAIEKIVAPEHEEHEWITVRLSKDRIRTTDQLDSLLFE